MSGTPAGAGEETSGRGMAPVAAAWLLTLGVDLFLHAGLLARLYVEPSSFLLPAESAFRRIPAGYATFLLLTVALWWLQRRLGVRGCGPGLRFGLAAGLVVWGSLALGLYSISTASPALLVGWWIGQGVELGAAGAVLGAAAVGTPMRRIWGRVLLIVLLLVAVTVTMQSVGLAPAMRVAG
ncbi:MAG TPA: hypothetical protein VMV46_23190 [Thermoanaerobaculia bacterium]|nr:hypothetical protein [Thermoanaerobaculia bacterium]